MATIHTIQKGQRLEDTSIKDSIGTVGYALLELAALNIPVSPGYIIEIQKLVQMAEYPPMDGKV